MTDNLNKKINNNEVEVTYGGFYRGDEAARCISTDTGVNNCFSIY